MTDAAPNEFETKRSELVGVIGDVWICSPFVSQLLRDRATLCWGGGGHAGMTPTAWDLITSEKKKSDPK